MEDHVLFNVILAHACAMSIIIYYNIYINNAILYMRTCATLY